MPDFDAFHDFETALLAAAEGGDLDAACETVVAADDFPGAVRRMPMLPLDLRRRMAGACVELYRAADDPGRRDRLRTVHAALLARQTDLLDSDGFEAAVLAAMHIGRTADDEKRAALETALASGDVPRMADRLRAFEPEFRRRLAEHVLVRMWDTETDPARREGILWLHTVLAPRQGRVAGDSAKALLGELAALGFPDEAIAALGTDSSLEVAARPLAELPRDLRRRVDRRCADLYAAAPSPERREALVWLRALVSARPLEQLDYTDLEPMLRAAVERGDAAAACAMVLGDHAYSSTSDKVARLPRETVLPIVEECAARFAGTPAAQRLKVLRLHARLSLALDRPDDLLAAPRQEALAGADPGDLVQILTYLEIAWLELASGRDIPLGFGARVRHESHGNHPFEAETSRKITRLLAERHPPLNAGEPWTDLALAELADLPSAWTGLVRHAATAVKAKPDAAWRKKAGPLLAGVDESEFRERVLGWLALVGGGRMPHQLDNYNYDAARGLVWLLSLLPEHPRTVRGLGALLERALRRMPGVGPGMPKLAGACANALSAMEGEAALAELARLTTRVTYKSTLKLLEAGLAARAQALGLGRDEIEELAVPAYGLTEVGRRVEDFGAARAELLVDGRRAELRWYSAAGAEVKSVPAAVRRDHPEALKELKAQAKDAAAMLTAVARRLDRGFLTDRSWPAAAWRERYLDHPLVGTLARRLIWTVDGTSFACLDGAPRDLAGDPVEVRGEVRLWHPAGRPVEEVLAWRERLEEHRITQPVKQAHREVYLLTDAERRTRTYSNRFAGHILRQYPFRSLAAERGWRDPRLRICHHDHAYPPAMRDLPEWGIRAEYWVRGDGALDTALTTDSGAYALLAADQVRFYPADAPEHEFSTMGGGGFAAPSGEPGPLPLEEVPPRVFSEVMRDVDLFVGVTSVGNDPTWQDGGPGGRHREYWSAYSFGELSETARTRHDLLVRLLPRLAVGARCRVEGRFLHVAGDLHTYRIHLGSGNILMDPGDRYLCVVPDSTPAAPDTYLPFDGDRMLSLILSKALLLADDTKITDPAILSQLK
ncbi:DUF4132 domain-containing protein [Streptomonospora sp. S1-112]|uniref:DUF4132 domain-containing protein n=1 Tax=Streptomonospora mangrovi TaxID=2883123 RepID=A0A9X3NID1_9ACTN|nr:DUF4132 domain-containing protein [Streptomonospora mangrovi]MDA0563605.1 DUF4132 domain-containing protein [Streptomonospora mangrovi]